MMSSRSLLFDDARRDGARARDDSRARPFRPRRRRRTTPDDGRRPRAATRYARVPRLPHAFAPRPCDARRFTTWGSSEMFRLHTKGERLVVCASEKSNIFANTPEPHAQPNGARAPRARRGHHDEESFSRYTS